MTDSPDRGEHPKGTLAITVAFAVLLVVVYLAIYFFVYVPRGAVTE